MHSLATLRVLLDHYYLPVELEQSLGEFVAYNSYQRYHESLSNLTLVSMCTLEEDKLYSPHRRPWLFSSNHRELLRSQGNTKGFLYATYCKRNEAQLHVIVLAKNPT